MPFRQSACPTTKWDLHLNIHTPKEDLMTSGQLENLTVAFIGSGAMG